MMDPQAPAFGSSAPKTRRGIRASTMAPMHIVQGSNVTYNVLSVRRQLLVCLAAARIASSSACAVGS